jgi:hypothetical protein
VLLLSVLTITVMSPSFATPPPSSPALLNATVLPFRVSVASGALKMPPPRPSAEQALTIALSN